MCLPTSYHFNIQLFPQNLIKVNSKWFALEALIP